MSGGFQDELWPHFAPLWADLRVIAPGLLLAGGYGLFLKQEWLVSQLRVSDGVRTLVAIDRWRNPTPRATKDFDFIANLDLIASAEEQHRLHEVLKRHGFKVVPANARWQFKKEVGEGRSVVLDFHAVPPTATRDDIRVEARRVKPQYSLGEGIHGRENPEAIGAELHPFSFTFDGVEIVLPNPVTLALMKLVAMRDRWLVSQDAAKSAEEREEEGRQARKHAEDVCRVVAMMTREESEAMGIVLATMRTAPVFVAAAAIFSEFFQSGEAWGPQAVAAWWQAEDFRLIRDTLTTWFH